MQIIDYTTPNAVRLLNGTALTLIGYSILVTYNENHLPQGSPYFLNGNDFRNSLNAKFGTSPMGTTDFIQVYTSRCDPYEDDVMNALLIALRIALDITPYTPHHISAVAYSTIDGNGNPLILIYPTTTSLQGTTKQYDTIVYRGSPYAIDTEEYNRVFILQ